MSFVYYNWEQVNINWEDEPQVWEAVGYILNDLGIPPGAPPISFKQEIELQEKIDRLEHEKKEKLISVLIMIGNEEYKEKRKQNKKIRLKVSDIKTIVSHHKLNVTLEK